MKVDYRAKPRRPMSYVAWIDIGDGGPAHRCNYSDVSESGARLVVPEGVTIPKTFTLKMAQNASEGRLCHVIWRSSSEIGLRFDRLASAHRNLRRL
jgi:hypothetical protein